MANIPDQRNDENLAVAQTHLAFIRFHNRVVSELAGKTPSIRLFSTAWDTVVRHYQWMLRTDFLPRVVDPAIVTDVFTNGRRFFEVPAAYDDLDWYARYGDRHIQPDDWPTTPIEFSVAAYRSARAWCEAPNEWNAVFNRNNGIPATLLLLFAFSGTSGILAPPKSADELNDPDVGSLRLPSNWVADFRRLYDFSEAKRDDLTVDPDDFNITKRIDTLLVNPWSSCRSAQSAAGAPQSTRPGRQLNLAFRNLTRAGMVKLGSGQQLAEYPDVPALTADQIVTGDRGASLDLLEADQKDSFAQHTPLWFYILREAELNGGRLTGVGGQIVAEVFHRAMEGSNASIVRDPSWRPTLGPDDNTFRMVDLLLFAFEGKQDQLAPLG